MHMKTIHKIKAVLQNGEVAVDGAAACIDRAAGGGQGQAVASQVATDLIPIGRFCEDLTGNGTKLVEIELFNPKRVHWFANDTTAPVDATDLLGPCYFTAADEVGVPADPSTTSLAGRVWVIDGTRVGVETADAIGLTGPQGPAGP